MNGLPIIDHFQITGPFGATGPGETVSRKKIFTCKPATNTPAAERVCAQQILTSLARRAYRRPVTADDTASLMKLYDAGRASGSFERGVQESLRLILANPKFLFRSEPDPKGATPGSVYQLTDLELASRLSFFLWSSIPDDELIGIATQGRLKNPAVLDQQVKRMLADPKANAMVNNFAGPVAAAPEPAKPNARSGGLPELRRQSAPSLPQGDRTIVPKHHARRPQRAGTAHGGLHLRQ